jgi:nucleoside-diphosphate-sugar epimerase
MTGASGFVGTNLCKLLKAQVINKSVRTNQPFVIDGEVIIHLAGIADARNNSNSREDYFTVNTELTKKVFDAFVDSPAKKFIILSSVKAVTETYDGVITENLTEDPTSLYGKSKLAADQYLLAASLPPGKLVYVLRPTIITGPGVKGNLQRFKKYANHPLGWVLSAFTAKRSFCNVENLGFVIQQILDRDDIPTGKYLIADEDPLSAADLRIILSQKTTEYLFLQAFARILKFGVVLLAKLFPFKGIPQALETLTTSYLVSNNKIVTALGKKLPFSSKEGVKSISR